MITFERITEFDRGIVFDLLTESYREWLQTNSLKQDSLMKHWENTDSMAFDDPDTVGECVRITCMNRHPIGMFSWDPRKLPQEGIVGQNCIIPSERQKGYGQRQIEEIIRIFKKRNAEKITVTTAGDGFFLPARKMYLSCGFVEVKANPIDHRDETELIHYKFITGLPGAGSDRTRLRQ
jgi:GNAT superfamily N-acetyltransferase